MLSGKKIMGVFCLLAALSLLGAAVCAGLAGAREGENSPETAYTLCLEGDAVAVRADTGETVITDIAVSSLRGEDRRRLREGIRAESKEELMLLMEDLGS